MPNFNILPADPSYAGQAGGATAIAEGQETLGPFVTPREARGVIVRINLTSVGGGGGTLTCKIQGCDRASGLTYDILTSAALPQAASTVVVLKVHPDLTAAANTIVKDAMPAIWQLLMTHSDPVSNYTYTCEYDYAW